MVCSTPLVVGDFLLAYSTPFLVPSLGLTCSKPKTEKGILKKVY
jgi:hypothetical protein